MSDRIDTPEQDPQPSAPGAPVKSGSDDGSWALRNRAGVRLQPHEADKSRELDIRSKQNEALPIHSLPTEIFLQVIHHHMRPYLKHDYGLNYYHRLISLTGVCSRWCNVIRGSTSLWNRIHWSDSSEVVRTALRRSSSNPLDVVLRATVIVERELEVMPLLMTALNAHRDRWRSMDVSFPAEWREDVISALREPVLSLEKLSLNDEDALSSTREVDVFGGTAPRLKDLTLNGISIRWESKVLYDLIVLDLSWISFPSTTTILNVLSHSPRLRTVAISRCTTKSTANPSSPPVQLPHLTSLKIDLGGLSAIEDLLDHIEAPGSCSLAISLLEDEEIEEFLQQRVLKWMSKWKHPALVPLEGLLLEIGGGDLRVELSSTDRSEPLAVAIECSQFSCQLDQLRMTLPRLIDALVPWTKDVTTLCLSLGDPPLGPHALSFKQFMIEQVSRLPPVTSLEVWGIEIDSFLEGPRLGEVSSLLRNVRTLSFSRIDADEVRDCLDWICETAQNVKDAAEDSSDEPNHRGRILKVELRVLDGITSYCPELVETAVKRLEERVGSGNVLVIEEGYIWSVPSEDVSVVEDG
ncbi:hypothetical protein FRC04_001103 [Tulasnella sp. 424]|nr:hypothetical protein FRC04_001103 [Tulasnella sp. 424]KAG8969643.1 hypothetical protein FRC05_001008 [Tulasnella sp. 425]